jgi:glycosylphosphatidylinositol transamidase
MFLSSLATLNFSLAFLVGLVAAPLAHLQPLIKQPLLRLLFAILATSTSPMAVMFAGCWYWELSVDAVLQEAAYGWDVWGMYTQLVIWCVWWPAWLVGGILLWGTPKEDLKENRVQ